MGTNISISWGNKNTGVVRSTGIFISIPSDQNTVYTPDLPPIILVSLRKSTFKMGYGIYLLKIDPEVLKKLKSFNFGSQEYTQDPALTQPLIPILKEAGLIAKTIEKRFNRP